MRHSSAGARAPTPNADRSHLRGARRYLLLLPLPRRPRRLRQSSAQSATVRRSIIRTARARARRQASQNAVLAGRCRISAAQAAPRQAQAESAQRGATSSVKPAREDMIATRGREERETFPRDSPGSSVMDGGFSAALYAEVNGR
jgi:hypothetical protein